LYRVIILVLVILLVIMQLQFWQQRAAVKEIAGQSNAHLRASNEALAAEVEDLRQGMQAVEERARSQLGLIAEGEQFIQLVPVPDGTRQDQGIADERD